MKNSVYDWASDAGSGVATPSVHPEVNTWDQQAFERRRNQADIYRHPDINPVTGHGSGCVCSRCPGWYVERAKLGQASIAPNRKPNALTDQVIPVCILLVTFTLCSMVLLPVLAPVLALTAVSLALVVVALVVVVIAALVLLAAFTRTRRDLDSTPAPQVIRGRILRRR